MTTRCFNRPCMDFLLNIIDILFKKKSSKKKKRQVVGAISFSMITNQSLSLKRQDKVIWCSFSPTTQKRKDWQIRPLFLPDTFHRLRPWFEILIFSCYSKMNRKEPAKYNVSFLLGSLVGPIGRGVPGECQEDPEAAIKCHGSAFSPGRGTRQLGVWRLPEVFSLGAVHSLQWGHMSTEWLIKE